MSWIQISFNTNNEHLEDNTAFLNKLKASSITYTDAKDEPILEPEPDEVRFWNEVTINAIFDGNLHIESIKRKLKKHIANTHKIEIDDVKLTVEQLEEKDWVLLWRENYKEQIITPDFWIYPSWLPTIENDSKKTILKLDPGLAFGTGTHETTFLCLKWISLNKDKIKNKIIIDYGCGSGILAIAACLFGAKHVYAIDYDSQALTSTLNNAKENRILEEQLTILSPDKLPDLYANVIIANILMGPLTKLAPKFKELLVPKGDLVLSGILDSQQNEILAAYSDWIYFMEPNIKGDWLRMHGVSKENN